ncbi:G/U mismatch-specific DNA glycosylase [bacterium]|nr:MAG: G/U mismatch-specific DNA glycosylase [bacterium]
MKKPTPDELAAAAGQTMADILAPDLRVVFCGINPSVYSVVVGHHFARPGNRFWPTLHASGFTPRRFSPDEDGKLIELGLGITNVAEPSSTAAADLSNEQIKEGGKILRAKIEKFEPKVLAVLGITAYRLAFDEPKAKMGLQEKTVGNTRIWVLPNPSGLNAHYHLPQLAELFKELREWVED